MNNLAVHISSDRQDWATPQELFDELSRRFGPFNLDVCASPTNKKCSTFYTQEHDGLKLSWVPMGREGDWKCWMNPPYGRSEEACKPNCKKKGCVTRGSHLLVRRPGIEDWMIKAAGESSKGCTVCCLIPARIGASWLSVVMGVQASFGQLRAWVDDLGTWHTGGGITIGYLDGRQKFEGAESGAPFPSMVVVFHGRTV